MPGTTEKPDADGLRAAALRALESFDNLIAETTDPGVEALGARFELATALQRISPYEQPLNEPGFDPRADLAKVLGLVSDWCTEANEVGGVDAGDLAWRLQEAGYPLPDDEDEAA